MGGRDDGKPTTGLDLRPDEAIRAEERLWRHALEGADLGDRPRWEERPPRRLVDACRVRDPCDERRREGIFLKADLRAEQRRIDPELVDLSHREHEAATELHVAVASGDLEALV